MVVWVWADIGRAVAGGAVIGLACVFLMAMTGRVAGYSGIIYNAVTFKRGDWLWRWAFLGGTVAAGAALQATGISNAFVPLPIAGQWAAIALSGFLVGYGTVLGGGCTSGHGICGVGRLSRRSIVNMATFMFAGFATATITPFTPVPVTLGLTAATAAAGIVVNVVTTYRAAARPTPTVATASASADKRRLTVQMMLKPAAATNKSGAAAAPAPSTFVEQVTNWRELLVAVTAGVAFGAGLVVSAMTNPSLVLHFLQLDANWNPTLLFVMGTALPIALTGFYFIFKREAPVCAPTFHLPTDTAISPALVAGGILFGVGWGLAGVCPGPGVVTLVIGSPDYYAWFGAMVVGMWAYYGVTRLAGHVGSRHKRSSGGGSDGASSSTSVAALANGMINPFTSSSNLFADVPAPSLSSTPAAYHRLGVE